MIYDRKNDDFHSVNLSVIGFAVWLCDVAFGLWAVVVMS